jgi:hypothetical protein
MLRWLLLGLVLYGLGAGIQKGWVEVRWHQMFYELGVPGVPLPPPHDPADCSSARQAASPSR